MGRFKRSTFQVTVGADDDYDFDLSLGSNAADIGKINVVPTVAVSRWSLELFGKDTRLDADVQWSTVSPITGTFYHPRRRDGAEARQNFVFNYEDLDFTEELHGRLHNHDTVSRTYAVEIWHETEDTVQTFERFGAKGDGTWVLDAEMTNGSAVLYSPSGNFVATTPFLEGDEGKLVVVEGAGVSSATLVSTIASVTDATHAVLANAASTSTGGPVQAVWGTDDTDAMQAAIDSHHRIRVGAKVYCFTRLRLHIYSQLIGDGVDTSILSRMGAGSGGEAVGMTTNEAAQSVRIENISIFCNQIGTNNDGLKLGAVGYDYANNSYIDQVRVMSASGVGINIRSNIGKIGQVWVQNLPGYGTPAPLSRPNTLGFKVTNTALHADLIAIEGKFELGEVVLDAASSIIHQIQLEPTGTDTSPSSIDSITISAINQEIGNIYAVRWNNVTSTRRNLVRVATGVTGTGLRSVVNDGSFPITVTKLVYGVDSGIGHDTWSSPFTGTVSITPGVIGAGQEYDQGLTLTGPRAGDTVTVTGPDGILATNRVIPYGWVDTNDHVKVRLVNYGIASTGSLGAGSYRVDVWPRV